MDDAATVAAFDMIKKPVDKLADIVVLRGIKGNKPTEAQLMNLSGVKILRDVTKEAVV
jgi:hypothetical protein